MALFGAKAATAAMPAEAASHCLMMDLRLRELWMSSELCGICVLWPNPGTSAIGNHQKAQAGRLPPGKSMALIPTGQIHRSSA